MCAGLRTWGYVGSLKTAVMCLTGPDRTISHRTPNGQLIQGRIQTGVGPKKVKIHTNLFLPTIRIWRETLFYSVQMYFIALFQTPNMTVWPILRKLILFYFCMYYYYLFYESFCPLKNLVVTCFILSVYNKGYYMYIETSRPRQAGDRARLLSPLYNVTAARGPTGTTRTPYCVSFYYHMNGKHIGEPGLNSHSEKDKNI